MAKKGLSSRVSGQALESPPTRPFHSFHPDLPPNTIWGFDGIYPGPTFHARYGEPILVRHFNDLPQDHRGFGIPQVSTHLHNGHTPSESDGFPSDFYPSIVGGPERFHDHHYPNALAGFSYQPPGDLREALSTLFYHDHRVDFTAQNVYKGLAGFYLLFNEWDSGDETIGFRLPSGMFDVPMMFADKLFDQDGQLFFDLFGLDGLLGDKFTVNGKIQPFLQVHPRRYRFRWLNVGPSRFNRFFLTDLHNLERVIPFTQISSDGNLLPRSIAVTDVIMGSAERTDVIVDFSQFAPGTSIYLENRLEQVDGRAGTGRFFEPGQGNLALRFDVVLPRVRDESLPPPYTFYEVPRPTPAELAKARVRTFLFDRMNGQWSINGRFFDGETIRAAPIEETGEIWILENQPPRQPGARSWAHPIHIHLEEFQVLSRDGRPPPVVEQGRKDVVRLGITSQVRVFLRFRDFLGRYPMHCHNILHEDHAMMLRWDVVSRKREGRDPVRR
ncbi:MAG: multicopper oxidase domain-containing protein [Acidobacteria bacterium]|nr:multicopper oxidase domain-containing protein [Acidobacteriota bacterium]